MFVGVGEAALAPAAVSIIADVIRPQHRGAAVGVFLMGMVLGGPASIATGGILLSLANARVFAGLPFIGGLEPWRSVLVVVGASGFVLPLIMLALPEPTRRGSSAAPRLGVAIGRLSADWPVLAPTYLAMGLLSIGDYGLLAWVPSVLTRRFTMPADELGWKCGLVTVVAGIAGCLTGGFGSDVASGRSGNAGRLRFSMMNAALAALGAALVSAGDSRCVLLGLGTWTLFSSVGGIGGIAAIQDRLVSESRGLGMALGAFCNTLLGLGLGPTLVAIVTDRLFGNPRSVGFAISVVVVPAALAAVILLLLA